MLLFAISLVILDLTTAQWNIKVFPEGSYDETLLKSRTEQTIIPINCVKIVDSEGQKRTIDCLNDGFWEKRCFVSADEVLKLQVNLDRENLPVERPRPPVYVSKIRLLSANQDKPEHVEEYFVHWEANDNEEKVLPVANDKGYFLFEPPRRMSVFFITIKLGTGQQLNQALSEIQVIGPERFGRTILLPAEDSTSKEAAIQTCRGRNASVSVTIPTEHGNYWIGLYNNDGVTTDDGTYNTMSSVLYDMADVLTCNDYRESDYRLCDKVICSLRDVEYFKETNLGTGNLKEICAQGRGIPVSPSSEAEIRLLRAKFPDDILVVSGCPTAESYAEPLVKRDGDKVDCGEAQVVLNTDGVLEHFNSHKHRVASGVACKRLPEQSKLNISANLNWNLSYVTTLGKEVHSRILELFDGELNSPSELQEDVQHSLTIVFQKRVSVKEMRIFTRYDREYENSYAVITRQLHQCYNSSQEPTQEKLFVTLSKDATSKFHQLEGFHCSSEETSALKLVLEWPAQVKVTEIQFIEDKPKLDLVIHNDLVLKENKSIEILCTANNIPYEPLKWFNGNTEMNETLTKSFLMPSGWTSSLEVTEEGYYTCKSEDREELKNTKHIKWARVCNTIDLIKAENAVIESATDIRMGHSPEIICKEGYALKQTVTCLPKGVFDPNDGNYCKSIMASQLEEIQDLLHNVDFEPEELSDQMLAVVKDNTFMSTDEIESAIVILQTIVKKSYTKNKALANVFEATSLVSLRSNEMGSNVNYSRNQDCLDIIDDIGENAHLDMAYPLKLAANGLALMAIDAKEKESDLTLALYNNTDIDNLQYFHYDVEVEDTHNFITIPSTHAQGRVWFTAYSSKTYDPTNVASIIIGASFPRSLSNVDFTGFLANVTLQKLYYGPRNADCVFWNTEKQAWSREGLTKILETDEHVVCQTNHLTSFSVLMSRDDSFIPKIHKTMLEVISMAGCGVSCICLLLTVIGLVRFPQIRALTESIIHINFSVALASALLMFLIFIDMKKYATVCLAAAMCIHYLLLTSVCWMFCEALNLYLSVQSIFTKNNHILLMCLFAWGCPLLMVMFTAISDSTLESYKNTKYCWMSDKAVIIWFALPVLILALLNTVVYVLVIRHIARHASARKINSVSDLRSCFLLLIVLGSAWIFGLFTLFTTKVVFHYLFAITNSLQGFCVFYCYCGSKQHVISAWRSNKEAQPLEEKEVTMESKIVPHLEDQVRNSPSPVQSPVTSPQASCSTPTHTATYASSSTIMKVPTMSNNWYMNDDHF